MSSEQPKELRKVILRELHKATALTDGWLCFKYLDNGEESLSTFADISKGDVITYTRPHPAPITIQEQAWKEHWKEIWQAEAARKACEDMLKELGMMLNSRIAKMEIICSKSKTPLREGILMAYREIEGWERQQAKSLRSTTPHTEQEQP